LDIWEKNSHPNGTSSTHLPIRSFHAATQHIHNVLIEEFGDSSFNESAREEPLQEDIEPEEINSHHAEVAVNPVGFPCATGEMRELERGGC
jgi:hypothetical protein